MQKIINFKIDTTYDDFVIIDKSVFKGDTLTFNIKIYNNGILADLTGQTVDFILKKSDGTNVEGVQKNVANGVVTVICSEQAALCEGVVEGTLQITDSKSHLSTNKFTYLVLPSISAMVLEKSQDEIQTLEDLLVVISKNSDILNKYQAIISQVAGTSDSVAALGTIKTYIDTNLKALTDANSTASTNIANETNQNTQATKNITDLTARNTTASTNISALDTKNSTASTNITALDSKNSTASKNIGDLDSKNATATQNINSLVTANNTATTNKANLDAVNTQATANINALSKLGDVTNLAGDVSNLKAQVLESTIAKTTTNAKITKLDGVEDSFCEDMIINGNSIVNIIQNVLFDNAGAIPNKTVITNGVHYTATTGTYPRINLDTTATMLKPNTTYSLILTVKGTLTLTDLNIGCGADGYAGYTPNYKNYSGLSISNGKYVFSFATTAASDPKYLKIGFNKFLDADVTASKYIELSEVMILEGDWTNKNLPKYFTGISSVSESDSNKVTIESSSKNLLSNTEWRNNTSNWFLDTNVSLDTNTLCDNSYSILSNQSGLSGDTWYGINFTAVNFIPCSQGEQYTVSMSVKTDNINNIDHGATLAIGAYDVTGTRIGMVGWTSIKPTVNDTWQRFSATGTIPNGAVYVGIYAYVIRNGKIWMSKPQLEKGNVATTYVEPMRDKIDIQVTQPIRCLPNGLNDSINVETLTLNRNIGLAYIDNTYSPALADSSTNTIRFFIGLPGVTGNTNTGTTNILCDKFPALSQNNLGVSDAEGISSHNTVTLMLRINKTRLTTPDVTGLKTWLQANPIRVLYQLATPTTEIVSVRELETFKDGCLILDNNITPTVNLNYNTNLISAISTTTQLVDKIEEDLNDLENKVQDFTNLTTTQFSNVNSQIALKANNSDMQMLMNDRGYANTKLISGVDLNTLVKSGIYAGQNLINSPQNNVWFTIEVFNTTDDKYTIQRAMGFANGGIGTFERRNNLGTWGNWMQLATTEYSNLTLSNGWKNQIGTTIINKVGNIVTINAVIYGGTITSGTVVANIPVGFRPSYQKYLYCLVADSSWVTQSAGMLVDTNGNITFDGDCKGNNRLVINLTYTL